LLARFSELLCHTLEELPGTEHPHAHPVCSSEERQVLMAGELGAAAPIGLQGDGCQGCRERRAFVNHRVAIDDALVSDDIEVIRVVADLVGLEIRGVDAEGCRLLAAYPEVEPVAPADEAGPLGEP